MSEKLFNCHRISKRKDINKAELNDYLNDGWRLIKVTVGQNDKPYTVGLEEE
ncbi:hypothetical protein ACFYKX_07695 [Cytobacillus sp. FJAT-54145]|uniref:DUF4177 domain-containing protein n=1 Tax=Cytobacillus spartinae TaxID=3299023 RepID=A0ABW6K8F8_9BACI